MIDVERRDVMWKATHRVEHNDSLLVLREQYKKTATAIEFFYGYNPIQRQLLIEVVSAII